MAMEGFSFANATSSIVFETACIGSHEVTLVPYVNRLRKWVTLHLLTPRASGNAPSVTLDLTIIGTQSVVDHAPRGSPPEICPILNEVAGSPLLARICV